jgi:hypothetical protein
MKPFGILSIVLFMTSPALAASEASPEFCVRSHLHRGDTWSVCSPVVDFEKWDINARQINVEIEDLRVYFPPTKLDTQFQYLFPERYPKTRVLSGWLAVRFITVPNSGQLRSLLASKNGHGAVLFADASDLVNGSAWDSFSYLFSMAKAPQIVSRRPADLNPYSKMPTGQRTSFCVVNNCTRGGGVAPAPRECTWIDEIRMDAKHNAMDLVLEKPTTAGCMDWAQTGEEQFKTLHVYDFPSLLFPLVRERFNHGLQVSLPYSGKGRLNKDGESPTVHALNIVLDNLAPVATLELVKTGDISSTARRPAPVTDVAFSVVNGAPRVVLTTKEQLHPIQSTLGDINSVSLQLSPAAVRAWMQGRTLSLRVPDDGRNAVRVCNNLHDTMDFAESFYCALEFPRSNFF